MSAFGDNLPDSSTVTPPSRDTPADGWYTLSIDKVEGPLPLK